MSELFVVADQSEPSSFRRICKAFSLFTRLVWKIVIYFTVQLWKTTAANNSCAETSIIYQSNDFIILNKAFDILINSNDREVNTVQTKLRQLFPKLVNPKLGHEFNFVHRLDYATSGLLCIPANKAACVQASKAFEKRKVEKYYLAIVRGHVSRELLEINLAIGDDAREEFQGIRMAAEGSVYSRNLRPALTRILVLERGISHGYPATKVLLKPVTGRRHQLRLHLHSLGHTIVGDFTYSNRRDSSPYRMFLHAFRLVLPTNVENLDVQTDDPFTSSNLQNKWTPVETLNVLDGGSMDRLRLKTTIIT